MKYLEIESKRIKPNEHNPNAMTEKRFGVLKENIKENGIVHPLLVREIKDGYEIIDGEHRYIVALELKIKKLPCVVVDFDDVDTKLQTVNMNGIKGKFDLDKLEIILAELEDKYSFEQVLNMTAVEREVEIEIKDDEVIENIGDEETPVEKEQKKEEEKEKIVVSFSDQEHKLFIRAVAKTEKDSIPEAVMFMVDFLTTLKK